MVKSFSKITTAVCKAPDIIEWEDCGDESCDIPHGVDWHRTKNKWRARVSFCGKRYDLGHFKTPEEAGDAIHRFWESNKCA